MKPFRIESGPAVPLLRDDIDTDQIIPKQFLKRIERSGFGEFLFHDWRAEPDFVLNEPRYRGATVLIAGRNFGCGSSREHAPWALSDYGFRVVIAPSFADIFAGNCASNGLVPAAVSEADVGELARRCAATKGYRLTVDLQSCRITDDAGLAVSFAIDRFLRRRLLEGVDDIGMTLRYEREIAAFENPSFRA